MHFSTTYERLFTENAFKEETTVVCRQVGRASDYEARSLIELIYLKFILVYRIIMWHEAV